MTIQAAIKILFYIYHFISTEGCKAERNKPSITKIHGTEDVREDTIIPVEFSWVGIRAVINKTERLLVVEGTAKKENVGARSGDPRYRSRGSAARTSRAKLSIA